MTSAEALDLFRVNHAAEWYLLVNSAAWKAAKEYIREHIMQGSYTKYTPPELMAFGPVVAAELKGWELCMGHLQGLAEQYNPSPDLTFSPTYQPDDHDPETRLPEPIQPPKRTRKK